MDNGGRAYREEVFAIEREVKREADILRLAEVNETTPETILQGHLSNRWKRRDGDIYRAAAAAWVDFIPDPGWVDNSIRARIMNIGLSSTLQVIGDISAPLPANQKARVGILPEGYRPARTYRTSGAVVGGPTGITWAYAIWEITATGEVWTVWGIGSSPANSTGSINAIVPMD
ncbi:MAG TPA: hypothetical protein VHS97_23670 [Isosphaeraceae bacterium]|jgi:hypothetical protein|nr:hypothetical protein [Isosphaeraceae bacterium]